MRLSEPINARDAKRSADRANLKRLDRDLEGVYYEIRKEADKGNKFVDYYLDGKLSAEHVDRLLELGYEVFEHLDHADKWLHISFENPDEHSESATSDWEF